MDQNVHKYRFRWELIGDLAEGRPNLGPLTRLEMYRLMQFTFRDIIERRYGTEAADSVFYAAGQLAGAQFYTRFLTGAGSFDEFIRRLEEMLQEMRVGVLRIEKLDLEKGLIVLSISEDLDCSGLPELDFEICTYDEGFISGILESYTGTPFNVVEVDCWCTGDRTCRFRAESSPAG